MLQINPKVSIDWSGNGTFADANEDVTAALRSASWSRGRASVNEEFGMGTATVELANNDLKYNPFDPASALYPTMVPGRKAKIELVHNSITYPAFFGRVAEVTESFATDGAPTVTLQLEDEFGRMSRSRYRSNVNLLSATNFTATSMLSFPTGNLGILEDYGYNAGEYTMEAGLMVFTKGFSFDNGSHLEAAKLAAKQELGGAFFMAADGKPTFYNREHNSAAAVHATFTNPEIMGLGVRQADFYDRVVFKRAGLDVDDEVSAVFQLFPTGREIAPGSTDPLNTFGGEYIVSAINVVEPVPGTDYTANAAADGTGEDLTNKVSVSSWTSYGGAFSVTLSNTSGQTAYLTSFMVRGQAVRQSDESREITVSDSGAPVTNQTLRDEFAFNDDADSIRGYALFRLYAGTGFYPRNLSIRLTPTDDAEAVSVLGIELLKRLRITYNTGAWAAGIDDDFMVQSIRGACHQGGLVEVELGLWHEVASVGNFFRISGASGGGQDYSQIAAAAATTGDRIMF